MRVRVIRGRELSDQETLAWSQFQQADGTLGSPYFCPQFTQAVAAVRDDVFVGIMEEAERVVGFFPFQKGRLRIGRPVGGHLSDCHGVIADLRAQWDARDLIRQCGLSTWDFDHLVASQQAFVPHHRATAESPYLDLSEGYESYAAARRETGSEQIKKTGNLRRRLEREVGALRFEAHEGNSEALRTLLAWKSKQYVESGLPDVFAVKWTVSLLERLLQIQGAQFSGMLSTLYANGRLMAAHMGMRSQHVWHYWFPSYDLEFQKYSPRPNPPAEDGRNRAGAWSPADRSGEGGLDVQTSAG